jgi:hypothetical protein
MRTLNRQSVLTSTARQVFPVSECPRTGSACLTTMSFTVPIRTKSQHFRHPDSLRISPLAFLGPAFLGQPS